MDQRCILSKFYIKPQQWSWQLRDRGVVSYRNSTSNHNEPRIAIDRLSVVSYRNSTSNHNWDGCIYFVYMLYLIEILHQTTTAVPLMPSASGCILSKFYIKPQRQRLPIWDWPSCILSKFYIKPQRRASYWLIKCYLRAVCHYKNTIGCSDEASLMHFPYFKERK